MLNRSLVGVREIIRNSTASTSISATTEIFTSSHINQTIISLTKPPDISPLACIGFAVLILTTVIGNALVLAALFLDKRLHTPSFFLIANMAIADLLLGICVLPFSSVLELLDNRWIFGQALCSTWLAIDVLCCTASIIGLAGVSIDRFVGVTRPLNYSSIMTIRRTVYLIIVIWAVSILTSVVPLFGLTDSGTLKTNDNSSSGVSETCQVNQNTFYTIFSSAISFYIPVIILLILYSHIYQEAKKQGNKLESERRRLVEIDYQIAAEHARRLQHQANGHAAKTRLPSNKSDDAKIDATSTLLNPENMPDEENHFDRNLPTAVFEEPLKKDQTDNQNAPDDDGLHCGAALGRRKSRVRTLMRRSIFLPMRRASLLHNPNLLHYNNSTATKEELMILRHKLNKLKSEKKAFRTVGLILGALLICWLPFFVTLPLVAILKEYGIIQNENAINIWFKITFWLGYCNSALNPFVYAFSNRAIRRAFRDVLFRRFCFCCSWEIKSKAQMEGLKNRRRATDGSSFPTDVPRFSSKRESAYNTDKVRTIPKAEPAAETSSTQPPKDPNNTKQVVSFLEFLDEEDPNEVSSGDNQKSNSEFTSSIQQKTSTSNLNS